MKSVWTAGLEPDIAKEIVGDFKSSLLVRKRMKKLLEDKIEANRKTLRDKMNYDNASWAYQQADGVGYERALFEIISLIEEN